MDNLTFVPTPLLDFMSTNMVVEDNLVPVVIGCLVTIVSVIAATAYVFNKPPVALKKDEFQPFQLMEKEIVSHDTRKFTFKLQSEKHQVGLPIGQHIVLKFTDENGKSHQRSYTPISRNTELGQVTFCIKVYKAGVHPKFPIGGKLSQHLDSLDIGDSILMKGPKGHLDWSSGRKFTIKQMRKPLQTRSVSHLNMIAGGTGITPMLQVLHAIFDNDKDQTKIKMIYANQTPDDILVRDELEALARAHPDRFQLHYTVDKANNNWKYSVGFVTKQMMQEHLYTDNNNSVQTFMCGPPPMIKFACLPALQELGFTDNDWFVF